MATFSGLADDYPSLHVRVNEGAVHGHWLLIYLAPAPSGRVPINIQGLGAREGGRGQGFWREAEGERESARTEQTVEIYLSCLSVCGNTQGDKCLWEASGISSVTMEHVNWFCNDFHLCPIVTSCILVRSNLSLWLHLQLIGIEKYCNKTLAVIGKLYFSFCFWNVTQYNVICQVTWDIYKA